MKGQIAVGLEFHFGVGPSVRAHMETFLEEAERLCTGKNFTKEDLGKIRFEPKDVESAWGWYTISFGFDIIGAEPAVLTAKFRGLKDLVSRVLNRHGINQIQEIRIDKKEPDVLAMWHMARVRELEQAVRRAVKQLKKVQAMPGIGNIKHDMVVAYNNGHDPIRLPISEP